jgi:hypothetical protein
MSLLKLFAAIFVNDSGLGLVLLNLLLPLSSLRSILSILSVLPERLDDISLHF